MVAFNHGKKDKSTHVIEHNNNKVIADIRSTIDYSGYYLTDDELKEIKKIEVDLKRSFRTLAVHREKILVLLDKASNLLPKNGVYSKFLNDLGINKDIRYDARNREKLLEAYDVDKEKVLSMPVKVVKKIATRLKDEGRKLSPEEVEEVANSTAPTTKLNEILEKSEPPTPQINFKDQEKEGQGETIEEAIIIEDDPLTAEVKKLKKEKREIKSRVKEIDKRLQEIEREQQEKNNMKILS